MTKIEALEKTIFNLENDLTEYNWTESDHCNCGVVAKTLLNGELPNNCGFFQSSLRAENVAGFSQYAYCMTSDMPLPRVFHLLKEAGFVWDELKELEDLSNKQICERGGIWFPVDFNGRTINRYRESKEYLLSYLRAWVEILKEQIPVQEKEPKPERIKTVYVSVPETIKEQSKELVLS